MADRWTPETEENPPMAKTVPITVHVADLPEMKDAARKLSAAKAVLADREKELLELKGPCTSARCRLHYAHSGPCDTTREPGAPCASCLSEATERWTVQIPDRKDDGSNVRIADILPSRAKDLPWTWADEDRNTRTRQCLCCGRPGHYQQMLEAHMAVHGVEGLQIVVENGYVEDGHHRVLAAISLGIDRLPTETGADAQARWVRDHGHVDWSGRKFGDR